MCLSQPVGMFVHEQWTEIHVVYLYRGSPKWHCHHLGFVFFISIYCAFLSRLISIEKSRSELLDFVVPIINVILHAPCMEPLSSLSRRVMGHRIRWWIRPQECRKLLWENFVLDAAMALDVFILGVLMSIFSDGFEFCGRLQLHVFFGKDGFG